MATLSAVFTHTSIDESDNNSDTCTSTSQSTNSRSSSSIGCVSTHRDKETVYTTSTSTFSDIVCNNDGDIIDNVSDRQEIEDRDTNEKMNEDISSLLLGFKVVGDNIDKNVKPRHVHQDKQVQSMHYYHSYAVCDRVSISGLSDIIPNLKNAPILSIPVSFRQIVIKKY